MTTDAEATPPSEAPAPAGEENPVAASIDPEPQAEAPPAAQPEEPAAQAEAPPAAQAEEPAAQAQEPVQEAEEPAQQAEEPVAQAGEPATQADAAPKAKRKRQRPRRRPEPKLPKTRATLPLDELRDASRATMNLFGARQATREAFAILGPRERQDLSALVGQDEDHRPRARNIANGSLGAGRIDKAMAATIMSMAPREDLWSVTLDKELAAQKLGRIRAAKQRDEQRAKRAAERDNRTDRISRDQLKSAQDGRVGATIRFVTEDDRRDRRKKGDQPEEKPAKRDSVLDRLGY